MFDELSSISKNHYRDILDETTKGSFHRTHIRWKIKYVCADAYIFQINSMPFY